MVSNEYSTRHLQGAVWAKPRVVREFRTERHWVGGGIGEGFWKVQGLGEDG